MRAIEVDRFGGPEVLRLVEGPAGPPGAGEALVDVAAVDVIWVETAIRSGAMTDWFPQRPPYRPGGGVSGTVAEVGAGVDPAWVGRRMVTRAGGYADQVLVPVDSLVPVPDGAALPDAAAVTRDGVTAYGLMELLEAGPRDRVLVTAAAGGMGALLVQLARAAGATVVGAARGAAKLDAVRRLGADVAVDYSAPDWTDPVRAALGGVDVVLDGAGGSYGREALDLLVPGGRFSAHGRPAGDFAAPDPDAARLRGITTLGIRDVRYAPEQAHRQLVRAVDALAAGTITPLIGRTFPLERAADAHRAIEQRTVVGKALLITR
ncbi:zinc-binding dehydrogenase [Micromonospora sp. NPDC000089]|uniref:zinc-binding dehydrogenase n=1 Tax=unclassified Micromonospora TaxID=2617518 RepID=UPI0036BC611D